MAKKKLDNIMLIDDDEIANFIYTKIIANAHVTDNIQSFQSASEALEYIKGCENGNIPPDIIFLDINMPVMSGWDFLEEYKQIASDVKGKTSIYMLSSSVYKEDLEKARSYKEVEDYIIKPLTSEKLIEIAKSYNGK